MKNLMENLKKSGKTHWLSSLSEEQLWNLQDALMMSGDLEDLREIKMDNYGELIFERVYGAHFYDVAKQMVVLHDFRVKEFNQVDNKLTETLRAKIIECLPKEEIRLYKQECAKYDRTIREMKEKKARLQEQIKDIDSEMRKM